MIIVLSRLSLSAAISTFYLDNLANNFKNLELVKMFNKRISTF